MATEHRITSPTDGKSLIVIVDGESITAVADVVTVEDSPSTPLRPGERRVTSPTDGKSLIVSVDHETGTVSARADVAADATVPAPPVAPPAPLA